MKPLVVLIIPAMLGSALSIAQNVVEDPQVDPVLEAIQEFNKRDKEKPNEVTVVLEPEGKPTTQTDEKKVTESGSEPTKDESGSPVLVTGKPPAGVNLEKAAEAPAAEAPAVEAEAVDPEETTSEPENGLAVRVEKLQSGSGPIDPAQITLRAPFPAKPLARAPEGWHLDASDSAPPFTREVEISPGTKITLSIRPHLLVPDSDGQNVFAIPEPGYDNKLGYQQTATVGAILSNSIRQLDEDSKRLGNAIDSLQQLLVSLPKPPEPEPQPEPKPATNRKR